MLADVVVPMMLRLQLAGSAAILLVLLLRPVLRRPLGAELAYRLWALPPICAIASLFPTLAEFRRLPFGGGNTALADRNAALVQSLERIVSSSTLLQIWTVGAILFLAVLIGNELRFRTLVRRRLVGPAVVGVLWPRIVTPANYLTQFSPTERDHIRRHELTHIARRDPQHNLALAAVRTVFWFNPVVHLAAAAVRLDQELACDAALIDRRPIFRRQYAEALLKAHFVRTGSPLACAWAPLSRHPLELRVAMIARPEMTRGQYVAGVVAVGALALGTALSVWSLPPAWPSSTPFHWAGTPVLVQMDLTPARAP